MPDGTPKWTPEIDKTLAELSAKGFTYSEVALQLRMCFGKTHSHIVFNRHSVASRLYKLRTPPSKRTPRKKQTVAYVEPTLAKRKHCMVLGDFVSFNGKLSEHALVKEV